VVTRIQLPREVCGEAHVDEARYLRVCMSTLRASWRTTRRGR
jgi:DNA-binding response OmpR family regulator